MDYDPSGNLLAMKRYRSAGSLIDNLTYQYTSGTNRLDYTDDAVSTTGESWDAEDGSTGAFTYDLNGAMTALPAPYNVTSATYDARGMATKVVASGNTTNYRYNSAGERYWKKTSSGADYYALDGALQLGVFESDGTLKHWNVIAGGRVIGRHQSGKKYYVTDHLGTTRAVVNAGCAGSCTIYEARDYDAWGIELAGRTYLSGTAAIEGFTGKERDSETGLDYFGARYYMPSVGRWTSVDPLASEMPEWSPYNYSYNNPISYIDPDGRTPIKWLIRAVEGGHKVWRQVGRRRAVREVADGGDATVVGRGVRSKAKRAYEEAQPGAKTTRHDPHAPGQLPHFQHKNGGKGHVFYKSLGAVGGIVVDLLLDTVGLKANELGTDDYIPNDAQPLDDPANNPNMIPVDVDNDGVTDYYWDTTEGDTEDGTPAQEDPIEDADDDEDV